MNVRRPECDEQPFKPTLWNARLNQTTTLSGVIWPPRSERTTYVESAEDLSPEDLRPDLDRNAALFIPTLAAGEAIVIGPDLPAPVPININAPLVPPNSRGPDYEKYWRARKAEPAGDA
jgi:hypothetical protein